MMRYPLGSLDLIGGRGEIDTVEKGVGWNAQIHPLLEKERDFLVAAAANPKSGAARKTQTLSHRATNCQVDRMSDVVWNVYEGLCM